MDYEKLKQPENFSKNDDVQNITQNATIPEIAGAQKTQGVYLQNPNNQKNNNESPPFNHNEKVAKLSLNVYTETSNRSEITQEELKDAQVGHT